MKYDGENAYVLFSCNLHKERESMRVVAIAADKVTLYAIIGNEILNGDMDYKGYSQQKGFALFREDYKKGEISSANLDYGYYEEQPLIEQGYTNMQQEWETAYEWLNMDDGEYEALRSGTPLKDIPDERLRLILDRALDAVANDYRGAELYDYLSRTLEMSDDEIGQTGFNLSQFYAEPICEEEYEDDLEV